MAKFSDEARILLEGRHYALLGTLDPGGSIHLTPVWFIYRGDQVFVSASSASRKARNVVARPTASLVVDIRKPGSEQWVSVSGPVVVLRGSESKPINADIQKRYLTMEALRDPKIGPILAAADDVTLCIHGAKSRSWSAKDLGAQFFGGMSSATPERWFLPVD